MEKAGEGADSVIGGGGTALGKGIYMTDSAENAEAYATRTSTEQVGFPTETSDGAPIPVDPTGKVLEVVPNVSHVAQFEDTQKLIHDAMWPEGGGEPLKVGSTEYRNRLFELAKDRGFDGILNPAGGETHELVALEPHDVAVIAGSAQAAEPHI